MRYIFLVIVLAGLSACQTWDGLKQEQSAKYVGKPFDEIYTEWGVPTGIAPTRDGGRFIEFQKISGVYLCRLSVTTDSSNIVRKVQVGGQNGCVM